jgi:hypothetical protein
MKFHRTAFSLMAALAILATSSARADFTITIDDAESGFSQTFIDNDGFFDTNEEVGVIAFNATNLNTALAAAGSNFEFSNFGGDSNATTTSTEAELSLSGTITRIAAGTGSISVTLREDAFNLPNLPGVMNSTASQTFLNNGPGSGRTFQSIFDDSVSTPVLTFGLTAAPPNNTSGGGNAVDVVIDGQFSLSNISGFTMNGAGASVQFVGTTTVTAIPEPASLALMMLGGSALALRLRRRKLS